MGDGWRTTEQIICDMLLIFPGNSFPTTIPGKDIWEDKDREQPSVPVKISLKKDVNAPKKAKNTKYKYMTSSTLNNISPNYNIVLEIGDDDDLTVYTCSTHSITFRGANKYFFSCNNKNSGFDVEELKKYGDFKDADKADLEMLKNAPGIKNGDPWSEEIYKMFAEYLIKTEAKATSQINGFASNDVNLLQSNK